MVYCSPKTPEHGQHAPWSSLVKTPRGNKEGERETSETPSDSVRRRLLQHRPLYSASNYDVHPNYRQTHK